MGNVGRIAFIVGLVIAVAAGFGLVDQPWMGWVLAVLGAVVGYLNVSGGERSGFLIAGIALTISATAFSNVPYIGDALGPVMGNIMTFMAGAIFVVAIMALFSTAKN
jgi:hypothetical protein